VINDQGYYSMLCYTAEKKWSTCFAAELRVTIFRDILGCTGNDVTIFLFRDNLRSSDHTCNSLADKVQYAAYA
jgi:hypothetical protein